MSFYPGDVIDENRFHSCVGESEEALAFSSSVNKGITDSKQYLYLIQQFTVA